MSCDGREGECSPPRAAWRCSPQAAASLTNTSRGRGATPHRRSGEHPFDPGIPPNLDAKALEKQRINPDIRRAESRYIATLLRGTLESSGQWGAVRVTPEGAQFIDVIVSGRILESTGAKLALEVTVTDSTGRVWINARRYQSPPDTGAYKTDTALKARDPVQTVYSATANAIVT